MREVVMFIAHQTARELMNPRLKCLGPYGSVKFLIFTAITASMVSIGLTVNTFFVHDKIRLPEGGIFAFYLFCLLNYFLIGLIFKRSTLARSIRIYKGTKIARVGGAIGLGYLLLNIAVIALVIIYKSKFA